MGRVTDDTRPQLDAPEGAPRTSAASPHPVSDEVAAIWGPDAAASPRRDTAVVADRSRPTGSDGNARASARGAPAPVAPPDVDGSVASIWGGSTERPSVPTPTLDEPPAAAAGHRVDADLWEATKGRRPGLPEAPDAAVAAAPAQGVVGAAQPTAEPVADAPAEAPAEPVAEALAEPVADVPVEPLAEAPAEPVAEALPEVPSPPVGPPAAPGPDRWTLDFVLAAGAPSSADPVDQLGPAAEAHEGPLDQTDPIRPVVIDDLAPSDAPLVPIEDAGLRAAGLLPGDRPRRPTGERTGAPGWILVAGLVLVTVLAGAGVWWFTDRAAGGPPTDLVIDDGPASDALASGPDETEPADDRDDQTDAGASTRPIPPTRPDPGALVPLEVRPSGPTTSTEGEETATEPASETDTEPPAEPDDAAAGGSAATTEAETTTEPATEPAEPSGGTSSGSAPAAPAPSSGSGSTEGSQPQPAPPPQPSPSPNPPPPTTEPSPEPPPETEPPPTEPAPAPVIGSFTASAPGEACETAAGNDGARYTMTWSTEGATAVTLDVGGGPREAELSGSRTVCAVPDTTATLAASNDAGTVTKTAPLG
jgi:nicotinate-nucleotide--dimethylbenzimidazole phosphoribosyltransferase